MSFECINVRFSEVKDMDVVDSNGEKLGRVNDFMFKYEDGKIQLTSVIIGGSRFEELIERIGLKEDQDPIFGVGCIERIEDNVYLKTECDSLSTSYDPTGKQNMSLSKLAKIKVVDSDGFKVGTVTDVWFDSCGDVLLILEGGTFESILEKLKLRPDIDLLLPEYFIKNVSEKEVCLQYTKFQLESTAQEEYQKYKSELATRVEEDDARTRLLKLTGHTRGGVT